MVTKSKLKMALNAEKGVDFKKMKQKKVEKDRKKKKVGKGGIIIGGGDDDEKEEEDDDDDEDEVWEDAVEGVEEDDEDGGVELDGEEEEDDEEEGEETVRHLNLAEIDESDSDSSDGADDEPEDKVENQDEEEDEEEEDEEEEEDIPMSDLEDLPDEDKEDLIPHQRLTINNTAALTASLKRIALPLKSWPFSEHQSLTAPFPTDIPDISDDLNRELAFYKQALAGASEARKLLKAEGVPFSRPNDYFAEMVKPDEHMEKIKARLVEEAADKKASAEARKQRDLKKFGKQVQVAKLQERQKEKRETLEKIKVMKRKRQEGNGPDTDREADLFDVALEDEISKPDSRRDRRQRERGGAAGGPGAKRQKRDQKFGFGGKKRFSKSGDAVSSGDLSGFSVGRMKGKGRGGAKAGGGKQRLGKARRMAGRR